MAGRRQLKSVAAGIAGSFNSRNNDLEGYWAIGKLCRFSQEQGVSLIRLDLLNLTCSPANAEFDAVMYTYKMQLAGFMSRLSIPTTWLMAAYIEIDFQPEYDTHLHYFRSALGYPYTVQVKLCSDLGKHYSVKTGGNCRPHDPSRESKRFYALSHV